MAHSDYVWPWDLIHFGASGRCNLTGCLPDRLDSMQQGKKFGCVGYKFSGFGRPEDAHGQFRITKHIEEVSTVGCFHLKRD